MKASAIEEEAQPRFLLTGPVRVDAVAAVLASLQPVAMIVGGDWDRRLLDVVRDHGAALLLEDDVDANTDGVHLTDPKKVAEIRSKLDHTAEDRLILGADVGLSRHDAMVAGEEGADYIAFGERDRSADDAVLDLVDWWRSVTVLPCLAYAADTDAVSRLVRIGADFIGISKVVADHLEGPAVAARDLAALIEKS